MATKGAYVDVGAAAGGVPALVRLIRNGSPVAKVQGAAALAEVGAVPHNRDGIAQAGAVEPLVVTYLPAAHSMQSEVSSLPSVSTYVPGLQPVHAVSPPVLYVPAPQASHSVDGSESRSAKPPAHGSHTVEPSAEYMPAPQLSHASRPSLGTVPLPHTAQTPLVP